LYQALYRKYRPSVFDDVCGQDHITSVLKFQCANHRVSHAYLFCGSRGTGKTTCAKILAKAVNCENSHDGNPCGVCDSCRAIDLNAAPDVLEMDAASNNGVDYIRDIRDAVAYTPAMLKKRVYIIDEVHMLSGSAFNALLKTLEEPPEHVVFILATTELHKLPATIISRCQRFDFRRIPLPVLAGRLHYIAEKENIQLENAAALRLAKQAQGGMRDAISLFELCCGGSDSVSEARVDEILGLSDYDLLAKVAIALCSSDMKTVFSIISDIVSSSKDITVFWQELIAFYRDIMVEKYSAGVTDYLDLTEQELAILRETSEKFSIRTLVYHSSVMDNALVSMQKMPQMKRTIAEFACLRMCEPQLDYTPEALSARISQLEDKIALIEAGVVVDGAGPSWTPTEMESAANESPQEQHACAPAISGNTDSDWLRLEDMSEFLEKLSTIDKQTQSFLSNCSVYTHRDGSSLLIEPDNEFSATMLSLDGAKNAVRRALLLCHIAGDIRNITVRTTKKSASDSEAAEELFNNIAGGNV